MPVSSEFIDFLLESLAPLGPVEAKRMFGGAGLYCDGVMFALIADEAVYLKADDKTSSAYVEEGLEPFTYHGKKNPVQMSYWRIPERLLDDSDEFVAWAEIALGVAAAGARPKTKKKRKTGAKPKMVVKSKKLKAAAKRAINRKR